MEVLLPLSVLCSGFMYVCTFFLWVRKSICMLSNGMRAHQLKKQPISLININDFWTFIKEFKYFIIRHSGLYHVWYGILAHSYSVSVPASRNQISVLCFIKNTTFLASVSVCLIVVRSGMGIETRIYWAEIQKDRNCRSDASSNHDIDFLFYYSLCILQKIGWVSMTEKIDYGKDNLASRHTYLSAKTE